MKKSLLIMAVCLVWPLLGLGQYSISGRVHDKQEGYTLPGAHIVIEGTHRGVHTNAAGEFNIPNLQAGEYVVKVSFIGYEPLKETIRLDASHQVDFRLERSATMTEEVIVMATRAGDRTPATFTNLDSEELMQRNLGQDLPFLISLTPSVVVSSDAGTGVGYTWMNIRGSDNSRINVTINGIPVNDAESHGVWWVNMPDIASSVDNLQIQRGVGLSTNGAGAFGATISLQSHILKDETYAELNSSAGSFNTLKNTASFGTGLLGGHWAFDGRLSKITSDGYVDRAFSDLKSFYFSGGYYGERTVIKALTFSGVEKTYQAWYGVPSFLLETDRTFNPSGAYTDEEGNLQFYDNETDNYQQDHFQVHASHQLPPFVTANLALHYTYGRGYYEQYRENDRFSRYNLPNVIIGDEEISRSDLVRRRWLDNDFYGFTYSLNYNNYSRLEATLGGGYHIYDGDHFGEIIWARYAQNADIRHRYYDNNGFKRDFNSFAKLGYEAAPGLRPFLDLQFRYISYNFLGQAWIDGQVQPLQQDVYFNFFNPKAGISWDLDPMNNVYAFAGIGNREPVRRDFTESSPDSRPRAETLRNIELGYRHQGKRILLNANLYLMDYKDQLVLTGEINDVGGFSRTNIDNSYRAGIELDAGYIFSDALQWRGNASFSRNKIDLFVEHSDMYDANWNWIGTDVREYRNTDIAFSPSVVAASIFSVKPFSSFTTTLESKYVGAQYIDNTMSSDRMLDAYFVNHLRFSYELAPRMFNVLEFVFQVNNLFDVKYETNAWIYKGVVGDQGLIAIEDGYFPQAGRHFMAGLNLRF
jgi:iron complex outermembrane recepter protein